MNITQMEQARSRRHAMLAEYRSGTKQAAIARKYGLTRERIRQLLIKAEKDEPTWTRTLSKYRITKK
jgi:DNA-binding transcriptional regulator LsrR (DeoR family)